MDDDDSDSGHETFSLRYVQCAHTEEECVNRIRNIIKELLYSQSNKT
jgi:hypothetical protein